MTVIRPNSISGITSITAQANEINVFKSDGTLAGLSLNGVNVNTTTGISTYAALNVTGNISIGGTLTYQDVTNVDSLGIGTFRTGIKVLGGGINAVGVITATSFSGSGANLTGVLKNIVEDTSPQLGGNLDCNDHNIHLDDNHYLYLGDTQDASLFNTGSYVFLKNYNGAVAIQATSEVSLQKFNNSDIGLKYIIDGAVKLYYDNVVKFETLADGAVFDGDGVSEIKISDDGDGFLGASGSVVIAKGYFDYSGSVTGLYTNNAGQGVIGTKTSQNLNFLINNTVRMTLNQNGYLVPAVNNQQDLGTASLRWRNIYTNDLNLSNKGSTNSVDNTWGDYTIQEGESDLFLINNRNGKKYKFNLTEVS